VGIQADAVVRSYKSKIKFVLTPGLSENFEDAQIGGKGLPANDYALGDKICMLGID